MSSKHLFQPHRLPRVIFLGSIVVKTPPCILLLSNCMRRTHRTCLQFWTLLQENLLRKDSQRPRHEPGCRLRIHLLRSNPAKSTKMMSFRDESKLVCSQRREAKLLQIQHYFTFHQRYDLAKAKRIYLIQGELLWRDTHRSSVSLQKNTSLVEEVLYTVWVFLEGWRKQKTNCHPAHWAVELYGTKHRSKFKCIHAYFCSCFVEYSKCGLKLLLKPKMIIIIYCSSLASLFSLFFAVSQPKQFLSGRVLIQFSNWSFFFKTLVFLLKFLYFLQIQQIIINCAAPWIIIELNLTWTVFFPKKIMLIFISFRWLPNLNFWMSAFFDLTLLLISPLFN